MLKTSLGQAAAFAILQQPQPWLAHNATDGSLRSCSQGAGLRQLAARTLRPEQNVIFAITERVP